MKLEPIIITPEEYAAIFPKSSKYRNIPTEVDGIRFASRKEAQRYGELKLLEQNGYIRDLRLQVRYPLVVNGMTVCTYVADFVYQLNAGPGIGWETITEDVKSGPTMTPTYRIKKRLMMACHSIIITEV